MTPLVVLILILALIFGGVGLFVDALWWLLIIAAVLFLLSLASSAIGRGRRW